MWLSQFLLKAKHTLLFLFDLLHFCFTSAMRSLAPVVALIIFAQMILVSSASPMTACPLDLSSSNFTKAASLCSNKDEMRACCRYINAFVAVSVARYANTTGRLGVTSDLSDICLQSVSEKLTLYGIPQNTTVLCSFGTKIPVNYECRGLQNVKQMLESPQFMNVSGSCKVPISAENDCKKCVNAAIWYLYNLVGTADNLTFSTCRDATFAALASQLSTILTADLASCYFGVPGISSLELSTRPTPKASPNLLDPANASQQPMRTPRNHYHLSPASGIGIALIATAMLLFIVLIFIIRKKKKKLSDTELSDKNLKAVKPPPRSVDKFMEGPASIFRKFSYKETKAATTNFSTIISQSGSETVYKAQFKDGLVVAVKKMNNTIEQTEEELCREIEFLARLHHRHLVALKGYCIEKKDRFLMYEFMAKGSLEDHLHATDISPLSWQTRIQTAIDVANALEYLHFYHDPPLCHKDIKSSNILLDENFVAKVEYFGQAVGLRDGTVSFGINPGYVDPGYAVTQELTEKSDVYSYGVLLLEIITARKPIQGEKSLLEWAQPFMSSESTYQKLVDINICGSFDVDQLQTIIKIVKWCTQMEGSKRPSIKQVLRLLYESSETLDSGFIQAVDDDKPEGEGRGRSSKEELRFSGDVKGLGSSNGTARSFCSRSFLLESGSPQNHLRY